MKSSSSLGPSDFVHLHNHTQYSLLDGLTKIPALMDFVKDSGMEAVAITDHGTLSGLIEFYKEAKSRDIKPLLGMEAYVAPRSHTDRDPSKDKTYNHLILIAENHQGYQNLMKLSTIANLDGFYYKPRIDHELLEQYNEGLIILSGCIGGEIGSALREGQYDQAKETALWYRQVFGDRYYLEVQDHGHKDHPYSWDEQVRVTEETMRLAEELNINMVLTADAHYLRPKDQEAHEILLCVQTGSFLADNDRMSLKEFELAVTEPKNIIERWGKDYPELITNSKIIAQRCNIEIELGKILIPLFPVPKGETEKTYLDTLVYQNLAWRYGGKKEFEVTSMTITAAKKCLPAAVSKRAAYELGVIDSMNFNGYFLIIADFINWGKDKGIVFGPGRGSAAGSIIAYALKITEIDPLKYDLLFERFLNPDRISMPDIDIDIQDTRRDEVIQYCVEKYGSERVANIVTFGRMAARNAIRDVARVLQVPYVEADRLAKMIPPPVQGRHIPLSTSLKDNKELKAEYKDNPQAKKVFDLATQLEGTIRSHGVHAAGVVIAPDDIVKFVPLEKAQKGVVATQYSMGPIDELGLLKIDFLGLSNLTVIKNALRIIKKVYNKEVNINDISLEDKKTFGLFQRGDTTGVFQLESSGMKRYLRELKPTLFDDIIAMGALYRPGPLSAGLTDKFINRKNGKEAVSYDHELMRGALKDTYGVMVYQEQFMQIARDMCGFTGGESDTLRKAVGKKNRDLMAKMKDQVISGAVKKGVDKDIAEKFWKDLEGFADYAFNKSHAACYGMIAYQTAYLKAHYPAAFMAALMTSDYDNIDRLAIEITECKYMKIEVLAPDVNESFLEFAVVPETKQIRFGLAAVKNVGAGAVEEILRAREENSFESIEDFLNRVSGRVVNKKTLESLIKAGAMDRFGERGLLLNNLDSMLAYSSRQQRQAAIGQTDLFASDGEETDTVKTTFKFMPAKVIYTTRDQLIWERELLGLYLSQHPLEQYEKILAEQAVPLNTIETSHDGLSVSIGGAINDVREITTKKGQKMAFVKIADHVGEVELILFPGVYQKNQAIWERDRVVLVNGKVDAKDRNGILTKEIKITVETAREISHEDAKAYTTSGKKPKSPNIKAVPNNKQKEELSKRLFLRLEDGSNQKMLLMLKEVIDNNIGTTEVVLVLGDDSNKQIIRLPARVNISDNSINLFSEAIGKDNVKLH